MVQIETLPNGVRLVTEAMDTVRSAALGIWVGGGSREETPEESGAAHFIEHMLFKGTQRRTAQDIARETDAIGGQMNAFTTKECTCFYGRVLDDHLPQALDILFDMVYCSSFAQEAVETERGVILEEIDMYEDTPDDLCAEKLFGAVFAGSPLARPILGREETLAKLRRENLALQDEEAALLHEAGYPPDALDETPFCPLCNDRGWKGPKMCSCLKSLCQQEQIAELSSLLDLGDQSFNTFRLDYYDRQVWPEFRRSPRESMEMVLSCCRSYAEFFDTYPHKNLFLCGAPGLGKTFLSACIARVVSEKGYSVVYDTASNVFARFEARKFIRFGEDARQAGADTRRYLTCDLLILDDLGSEFTSPFTQAALYEVINTRLVENKHTVISSNLSLDAIRQRYSAQVASRLEGMYQTLVFFGQDIRMLKKQQR